MRKPPRWEKAANRGRYDGRDRREQHYAPIDVDVFDTRHVDRRKSDQPHAGECQGDSKRTAGGDHDERFVEDEPEESESAGAERETDAGLALLAYSANEHQVADVDADDQEDRSDRAEQQPE